jgi:hypothetical protein
MIFSCLVIRVSGHRFLLDNRCWLLAAFMRLPAKMPVEA